MFFMFLWGVVYFYFYFFCNILRINPWLVVQNLTRHTCAFQSSQHHFAGGPNTEKIKSSVQALKLLWADWAMLSEHTARGFLASWKKYFSEFSCSTWTQNIKKKSRTYCMCIFGCRIEVVYYWIIRNWKILCRTN